MMIMEEFHADVDCELPGSDMERRLRLLMEAECCGAACDDCKGWLRRLGLRPTRQRLLLSEMLFGNGNRHVTAEMLYEEALKANITISLATIYNTLNQLTEAGLLRQIGVDGTKSFFDTNPSPHHHFYVARENALWDIPSSGVSLASVPQAPEGYEIDRVDVVVRLRRKKR